MSRRGALRAAGILLVLAGLVIVGVVVWQLWGTTYVSHRRQAETVDQLQDAWRDGATDVKTDHGTATAVVRIPAFGADYEVPLLEGTSDDVLATGFGHFPDSAGPGEDGNFAVAAHRITHGEPLRNMPDLDPGDQVLVETEDEVYVYELDTGGDDLEVSFTADWVLQPQPANPDADGVGPVTAPQLLTLTTCADLFHSDERLVAFGHLVETRPR
jgi:sortase A